MTPAQTPERPVTWSDEELRKANAEAVDKCDVRDPEPWAFVRHLLSFLGAVHPAEAREREREAYLAGCAVGTTGETFSHLPTPAQRETVNIRYPSLTPPSPPPLVLSTGVRVSRNPSGTFCIILADNTPAWGNTIASLGQYATTVADFTAIAKWLQEAK